MKMVNTQLIQKAPIQAIRMDKMMQNTTAVVVTTAGIITVRIIEDLLVTT